MKRSELKHLIREVLNESPDSSSEGSYFDVDTIIFYLYNGKIYVAYPFKEDIKKKSKDDKIINRSSGYIHGQIKNSFYPSANKYIPPKNQRFLFPDNPKEIINGRIFCSSGTLTFWRFPETNQEMQNLIRLLRNEINDLTKILIPISPDFNINLRYIEVPKIKSHRTFPVMNIPRLSRFELIDIDEYQTFLDKPFEEFDMPDDWRNL